MQNDQLKVLVIVEKVPSEVVLRVEEAIIRNREGEKMAGNIHHVPHTIHSYCSPFYVFLSIYNPRSPI